MNRSAHPTILAGLLLAMSSCEREASTSDGAPPVVSRPAVQLSRCDEVALDGTCMLNPGTTTLWIWVDQQERSVVRLAADGVELEPNRHGVDGGLGLSIEVPADARSLTMTGVDPAWSSDWTVALQRRPEVPIITANRERAAEGRLSDAVAHLEAALNSLPDEERLAALGRLLDLCFARNDLSAAPALVKEIVELGERLSMRRTAARAASTAVFIHAYQRGELSAARPYVAVLDRLGESLPEAAVWAAFCRGLMARLVGDPTRALDAFRRAARMADRLGMDNERLTAREGLGVTYAELARGRDAMELAQRALADAERPGISCSLRYTALNNAGWVQLMLQQRQVEHADPEELFERALALVGAGGECPNPTQDANLRINLALSALARHQPAMALAWLEPVEPVPARYEAWAAEVRARAGLALGRPELMPSLIAAPDPRLPDAERWNALMRWAAALEQQGMRTAAIDAYVDAEAIVDESMTAIGVDRGRELFLFGRQASARGLVRTLAATGRHRDALCHARLARGRALRQLDRAARLGGATPEVRAAWEADVGAVAETLRGLDAEAAEDWQFSSAQKAHRRARRAERQQEARRLLDQAYQRLGGMAGVTDCADLPRVPPSEVMLLPFPLDQDWLVFVSDDAQVEVHRVAEPPLDGDRHSWAAPMLDGAAASIDGAERVRILPTGRSWSVPFHALPWRDGVLLDAAPVVYTLDLVRADAPMPTSGTALVVADPSMNLPLAREEARAVTQFLEDATWTVEQLEGPQITRAGVESALARASLLHYAGHGEHAGTTGWDARLLIGKSEKFGVRDVLALPRVPEAVVLSGCETGRVTQGTLEGGMNLGRAFILAGSRWVVAVDRKVGDEVSSAVGQGLYEQLPQVGWDGASALRRVQQTQRAAHPDWDWAAFRAIER